MLTYSIQNLLFVGWKNSEPFAVPARERHHYHMQVTLSWRELETHRMLCVPTLPMFAYYFGAFGNGRQSSRKLLQKKVIPELAVMSFACVIRAAELSVPDLFLQSRFWAP